MVQPPNEVRPSTVLVTGVMSGFVVKGSRTPAADERDHLLGRQASEKPQGRKPRDRFARWWRAMGIVRLPAVGRWAGPSELGRDEVVADGDEVARRTTLREHAYRTDTQEREP